MNIRTALPRRHTAHTLVWITLAALAVRAVRKASSMVRNVCESAAGGSA